MKFVINKFINFIPVHHPWCTEHLKTQKPCTWYKNFVPKVYNTQKQIIVQNWNNFFLLNKKDTELNTTQILLFAQKGCYSALKVKILREAAIKSPLPLPSTLVVNGTFFFSFSSFKKCSFS